MQTARDPAPPLTRTLEHTLKQWGGRSDLWVFGYASLIWRADFEAREQRLARVHGWHRALQMWSRINRGTPQQPGLVFALLGGGSCQGVALRVQRAAASEVLHQLWQREMPSGVYDPRWLRCSTPQGPVRALAFTLSRRSPSYTGPLTLAQYQHIFQHASGRYGHTADYARQTYEGLLKWGIEDRALGRLLTALGHAPKITRST